MESARLRAKREYFQIRTASITFGLLLAKATISRKAVIPTGRARGTL
ncbi:MAG: hypothetical protein ABR958_09765 [Dehalococcoidales bacterium]